MDDKKKQFMKKKMIKCPYCGSSDGLYNDFNVSGREFYKFNGKEDGEDITSMYRHNKYMKCIDCNKNIMTYEEFAENYIQEG